MGMNLGPSKHKGHRVYQPMAEINVTPMVDVMLVLLIIFMVAAPMLTQGVQVALPQANAAPIEQDKPVEVTLLADGSVRVGSSPVSREALVERLKLIQADRTEASIVLRADKALSYGSVMDVMAALQAAGMVDVGLVTEAQQ
ncbi:MAG: protein TolR [Pseudomonadaceae bacterium]|nr:protein TolR [Pseudomonadaceae bacterium]